MIWMVLAFVAGLTIGAVVVYFIVNVAAANAIGRHFGW